MVKSTSCWRRQSEKVQSGKWYFFFASLMFGVSLFSYRVGGTWLLLSDIALVILGVWSLLAVRKVSVSGGGVIACLWLLVAIAGAIALQLISPPYHDPLNVAVGLLRAGFNVALLALLPALLRREGLHTIAYGLRAVIRLHAIALLGITGIRITIEGSDQIFRPGGLFAEPAWFGWFVALSLFALTSISKVERQVYLRWWDYLLILLAAFFSTSIVALLLIGSALVAAYWNATRWGTHDLGTVLKKLGMATVISLVVVVLIFQTGTFLGPARYLQDRLPRVLLGQDLSARDRIAGTLEVFIKAMQSAPLTGVGVGNEALMVKDLLPELHYKVSNVDTHVGFISVFIETGMLGGLLYLSLMISFLINSSTRVLGVGLFLTQLGFGGYRLSVFWFFFALGLTIILKEVSVYQKWRDLSN